MDKKKIKILAIDDISDNLVVLKALVNDSFPEAVFIVADSGRKGFELSQAETPDVILLDIVMPGMDGYEVCNKLKADIRLKHIPVIMVTANRADKESRVRALDAGADAFLPKPVDVSELKAQIKAMLRIKEAEDLKKAEKQHLEDMVLDRTEALEIELSDRKKAEKKLILSLEKITRNKQAIMNLMEDLKTEINERTLVEKNLQYERNLLRTLIDNLPDTIYVFDKECRKIIANKADVEIMGFDNEADVLGKTDLEMFPGESGKRFYAESMNIIKTGIPKIDYEEKFFDKSGNTRYLNNSEIPLYDAGGQIMGLVGIGHDITNRKIAEENIRLKNKELRYLNELATDLSGLGIEEDMPVFLMKRLKEFTGSEFLVFSEFDFDSHVLITRHIEADQKTLKKLINIAGEKIINRTAPINLNEANYKEIVTDIVSKKKSLTELSFGAIPSIVDKAFGSFTGFDRYFGLSFVVAGELYGTSFIGFKKNQPNPSIDLLKSFSHITAVSLQRRRTQEKLMKSEEEYRMLIENQGEGVGVVDLNENFVFVNPAAEEMFGVESGGLLNQNLLGFIVKEQRSKIEQETKKRAKSKKSTYEIDIVRPNGEIRTILNTATPQYDSEGNLTGTFGVFRDITDRKVVEDALIESYEFNTSLLKSIPFGMDIVDLEGNVLFHSENFQKIFGSEAIGRKCWELYRDDKKQCSDCPLFKGIKIGETESYESMGVLGGRIFDISHTGMMFQGKEAMLEIFIDITERKKMEQVIIESEAYYRTLIDISPDGILICDLEGNLSYGSIKAYDIFGVPPGEKVIGTSIFNWLAHESQQSIMERVMEIIKGNVAPETREFKLQKFDRSEFWGELSSSPLFDLEGNPKSLIIVCRDISDRKKTEQELIKSRDKAEESDRLKTAFLHNISHEIRTPMNAIIGFSAMLGEPDLEKESQNSYVEIITQSSNHLLSIVSDIIEISNIEAGILKVNLKAANLNSIFNNLHRQFLSRTIEKSIAFGIITTLPDSEADITTDDNKLIQVLSSLLSNAIKFTATGRVDMAYTIKDDIIEFRVSDTGIGIPEDQHNRIFERFYQVENSITRLYEGTGLGLSISRAYVELLGGKIWLTSKPGTGSVFYFSIPYLNTKLPFKQKKELSVNKRVENPGKKTVLIAEDEENNFRLMVELLSKLDLNLIHALNGKESVDICTSNKDIDLVIMDIKMPVMDGYEATGIIKKLFPSLPVIAQTAFAFESDREKALSAGCDDYISKPLKKDILLELIKKYL